MAVKRQHITTEQLKEAMARKWRAPEDALIWEVGDATGARHGRNVDALIMGLYPSRGIDLQGVEIKTQRSDWLRELKNPAKAEAISRYCDFWWIHATPDIVKPEELPTGWGLRVWDGRIWKVVVEALRRDAVPMSRDFLAALLRRSDAQLEKQAKKAAETMLTDLRAQMERDLETRIQQRTRDAAAMASVAEHFREAFGLDPEELVRNREIAQAARMTAAFMRRDLHSEWFGINQMVRSLRDVADRTVEAMAEIGLEAPDTRPLARMPRRDTKPIHGDLPPAAEG